VKSNIGHTLAAAGVAGVIKMVMALGRGRLPRTLHVDRPSPHVDWSAGAVELLTEPMDWPETDGRPHRAAVSSFGISGTNAHVILEQAPATDATVAEGTDTVNGADGTPVVWPLSARDDAALRAQAEALEAFATGTEVDLQAVAESLATTRAVLERRAVAVGADRAELAAGLRQIALGEQSPRTAVGSVLDSTRTVLVFPGQGSQWNGMALELYDTAPVFRDKLDACAAALAPHTDWQLLDVLRGTPGAPPAERVDVVQPTLFAIMVALAELWQEYGLRPDAVAGHSQGEIAAAHVAGALSLEDAARVVALRSKAITALADTGGMASVPASAERAAELIARWDGALYVAAVNGPGSTVVSGTAEAIGELVEHGEEHGLRIRRVPVDYASHCPHVEVLEAVLAEVLAPITPRETQIEFRSAVTGAALDGRELGAEYWYRNLREPVRFDRATAGLLADGRRLFVECSPHPVLLYGLQETIEDCGLDRGRGRAAAIESLRRDDGGLGRFLTSVGQAFAYGAPVDRARLFGLCDSGADADASPGTTRRIELPTYPFQRRRFWLEAPEETGDAAGLGLEAAGHGLLSAAVEGVEEGSFVFTGRISARSHPWLRDHAVAGTALLPATAFLDLAGFAAARVGAAGIGRLALEAPLVLPADGAVQLRLTVGAPAEDGTRPVAVHARDERDSSGATTPDGRSPSGWTRHAAGLLDPAAAPSPSPAAAGLSSWPPAGAEPVDLTGLYAGLAELGLEYGPAFQGLRAVWRLGAEVLAEAELPAGQGPAEPGGDGYGVHPALFDAALHALALARDADANSDTDTDAGGRTVPLPVHWADATITGRSARVLRARLTPLDADTVRLVGTDDAGRETVRVEGLTVQSVPLDRIAAAAGPARPADLLYGIGWQPLPEAGPAAQTTTTTTTTGRWTVTGGELGDQIAAQLSFAGVEVEVVSQIDAPSTRGPLPDGIIVCGDSLTGAPGRGGKTDADTAARTHKAVEQLARIAAQWAERGARIVVATQHAQTTGAGDGAPDPAQAALWGLIRSAQSEYPGRFTLADLDDRLESAAALPAALGGGEPQLAVRSGAVSVPRLGRAAAAGGLTAGPVAAAFTAPWDVDGTVLITGGTGVLGRLVAERLAATGRARHLLLTSRRGPLAAGTAQTVERLAQLGADAEVVACDTADRGAVDALLAAIPADRPLTAVIHAAGTLDDAALASLTPERLHAVLRPKVDGAWTLHQATAKLGPVAFVLFSSFAGTAGSAGQSAYAAANGFLDGLAAARRADGRPAVSLAWGLWDPASEMTGALAEAGRARMARSGLLPLSAELGLDLFDVALELDRAYVAPVALDKTGLHAAARAGALPPILADLAPAAREAAAGPAADHRELARRLAGAAPADRGRIVLDLVLGIAAHVLGHGGADGIEPDRTFTQLGFDSLTALRMRNALTEATGLAVPATAIFDHPTPAAVAAFLTGQLTAEPDPGEAAAQETAAALGLIDELGRTLSGASDSAVRRTAAARLRRLLVDLADSGDQADAASAADSLEAELEQQLESAEAADIFAFIDNELGRAHS
jgi:acyl transferase domain-containing protein/acyl carrier protein